MSVPAEALVRRWVALYTHGLPAAVRDPRRDEIEGDLWSHRSDALDGGQTLAAIGMEMVVRLVLGMPADITWRLEQRDKASARETMERSATMGSRIVALLAILGGVAMSIVMVWYSTVHLAPGEPSWKVFQEPNVGATMSIVGLLAMVGLVGAAGGVCILVSDRVGPFTNMVVLLGVLGGVIGLMRGYLGLLLFPVGSAVLLLSMARVGLVGWWLAVAHAAGALAFFVATAWSFANPSGGFPVALVSVYPLSWIVVGLVVLRGLPRSRVQPQPVG